MSQRPRQLNSEAGSSSGASSRKPKTIAEFRAALQELNAQLPPKSARLAEHERLYAEAVASSAEAKRFLDAQPSADEQRRAAAEAATKRAEAAAARRAEEEAARRAADEARKKQAAEEAQSRRAAEEAEAQRRRAAEAEEAQRRRAAEEAEAQRRRAAEEEATRKRRAAEEEAVRKRRGVEEAAEKQWASKRPASEAASSSSSSAAAAADDDDDDDCVFVGEDFSKSSSMPHARYDCRQFRLKLGEERQHCDKCWCGVCGVPVRDCKAWAEHCKLTRADADAKAAEVKRDVVKARVAAPRPPRPQLGPEQVALMTDPRWNAMRFTVISYIDKCSHDEDAVLAAVVAVHDDVSHEVATRVLRTLQAVGDVLDIDGALHLRSDTSLAPPPPPPPQPMDLAAAIAALSGQRPPPPHHLHAPRPPPPSHHLHAPRPPPPHLPHTAASCAMAMGVPPRPQVPSRPPAPHLSSSFRPVHLGPAPGYINGPRNGHLGYGYYR